MSRVAALILPLALCGCAGFQNALGGDGGEGANFVRLFVLFTAVCTFMYLLVMAGLLAAVLRRRRNADELTVDTGKHHESAPLVTRALAAWAILIGIGLTALTVASFFTDRSNATITRDPQLSIKVTGNQWWWDVQYSFADTSKSIRTANELHLPVGVRAEVTLESNDVIHSFWIPNLAGKQDLIPGRVTDIQLVPRKTGMYRGQCAEFCGVQHAHMALDVTVESEAEFDRWVAAQQRVAFAPASPVELSGYKYFITRQCSSCHNIAGTQASGTVGPDLTHVASRTSIAAGTLPMTSANLARWVADPQALKPGTNMPTISLTEDEKRALSAYLERLK